MSDRKDKMGTAFDILTDIQEFVEENEEKISEFTGGGGTISLKDMEPLKEVTKDDDQIKITIETLAESITELGFEYKPDEHKLIMRSDGEPIQVVMPDNADVENIEAEMNNGVVMVTVPRVTGGGE